MPELIGGVPGKNERPVSAALTPNAQAANAAGTCKTSLRRVVSIFEEARQGRAPPMELVEDTVDQLLASLDEDRDTLTGLVRLKAHSDYACMHSVAVCTLMGVLGERLGFDRAQRRQAAMAGLLHDIGKVFTPPGILEKPGRLTSEEFIEVLAHPERGYRLLTTMSGVPEVVMDVAHHHHERPDGNGYPHQLSGSSLSALARMGAVCDVYDAVTSNRPYKDGWDPADAMQRMLHWTRAGQFDTTLMAAFRDVMGTYPMGSLVRLRSQRLAVVSGQTVGRPSCPKVMAFYCVQSDRALVPECLDLAATSQQDTIIGRESNAEWRFKDLDTVWAGDMAQELSATASTKPSWPEGPMLRC